MATPATSGSPPSFNTKGVEKSDEKPPSGDYAGGHVDGHSTGEPQEEVNFALKKGLKNRHMQMIAIGGSIGTGLFVGSGGALQSGGPASLIICFILIGVMLLFTVSALAELAVVYPVNGAFFTHTVKLLDPAWGFAMGWNYAMSWLVVLPLELTAAGITIDFWTAGDINVGVWITVFLVVVTAVNFFGVKGYGEVEFIIGVIKVTAIIGFIILGIIINCGGVPTQTTGYIGGRYWQNGNAFQNGFKGFCSVFVTAAFAFAGTELVGLAAAESDNPSKAVPKASKQVFWRIALFYVISLTLIGLIVDSNDQRLLNASGGNSVASPFVIAIQDAGIYALPSIFNAVITLSVLSVANSSTYGSTRTIQALAMKGMAPKIFAKVDSKGRPIWSLIVSLLFGALAYINCAPDTGTQVFNWLLAISALSTLFTWASINANHLRFRYAWKSLGHSLEELPWHSPYGIIGSWIGLAINIIALIAQFYIALFDVGGDPPSAEAFFQAYLAAPIVIAFYVGYKIYDFRTEHRFQLWNSIPDMHLEEGCRLASQEQMEEKFTRDNAMPKWKKVYRMFC